MEELRNIEREFLKYRIEYEKRFLGNIQNSELLLLLENRLNEPNKESNINYRYIITNEEDERNMIDTLVDSYKSEAEKYYQGFKQKERVYGEGAIIYDRNDIYKHERPYLYLIYGGALPVPEELEAEKSSTRNKSASKQSLVGRKESLS